MLKTIFSLFILFCYVFTIIVYQPTESASLDCLNNKSLPYSYEKIAETKFGISDTRVFLIQDMHCHPATQKSISKILSLLDKKYALQKIYVEGAYGELDTSWLGDIQDRQLKSRIVDTLLDQGKLTGSEYYSIISHRPKIIEGIENEKLYLENVKRFVSIENNQTLYKQQLAQFKNELEYIQHKYLCYNNKRLSRLIEMYKTGRIDALKYYQLLKKFQKQQRYC